MEMGFDTKRSEITSYILMAISLIALFFMNMIPMLFTGMIIYMIIKNFHDKIHPSTKFAKTIVFTSVILSLLIFFTILGFLIYWGFKSGTHHIRREGIDGLLFELEHVVAKIKDYLPLWISSYIPSDGFIIKDKVLSFLHTRSTNIIELTDNSVRTIVKIIVGIVLGVLIGFSSIENSYKDLKPLSQSILERILHFYFVFSQVVLAQVKISLINTLFTAIYLLLLLPLFGVHLPYAKTITLLTFIIGLIPVVGNLITNTVTVLISLSISFPVALASLAFLIAIHKTEYFLNAKIVGQRINTNIWEILIAMVIMESLFGIAGLVASPIIYGYIKLELKKKDLI